jgi:hypothetical protein
LTSRRKHRSSYQLIRLCWDGGALLMVPVLVRSAMTINDDPTSGTAMVPSARGLHSQGIKRLAEKSHWGNDLNLYLSV